MSDDEYEDAHRFVDMDGKPLLTFKQEIQKHGFEEFVVQMIEAIGWAAYGGGADGDDGDYESHMLGQAEEYMKQHPTKVNLARVVNGKFNFSGKFRAPALHWFLTCPWQDDLKLLKHPSVTQEVINSLDNKGNSALYYCHSEHYQAGWSFDRDLMINLISDKRFCAVDFPLMPSYGGGLDALALPGKKVEALLKRNIALPITLATEKLRATINSTREGCSILHMVCDEILIERCQCLVGIYAALTGKHVASLKLDGDTTVNSLPFKMRMDSKEASLTLKWDTPMKFMNEKGALLDEDDKIEAINCKKPAQQSFSAHDRDGGKTAQVFIVAVRSEDTSSVAASLVKLIRSHPDFKRINHEAQQDNRGGFGNPCSHQIQQETCLAAVLRKVHNPARAMVVDELLKRHPSDRSRDLRVKQQDVLAALAEDNGYPASIVASIIKRGGEKPSLASEKPAAGKANARVRQPVRSATKVKASITKKPSTSREAKKLAGKR